MRKKLLVVFLMVSILTLVPTMSVSVQKPRGTMDLTFNIGWDVSIEADGDPYLLPDWVGHVTIDDIVYGMLFFLIDFKPCGSVFHFWEIWLQGWPMK